MLSRRDRARAFVTDPKMRQRSNYQDLLDTSHSAKEDLPAVTPVYVSIKELARLSGLSESTLRRLH
jgi:hypothetical protein